MVRFVFAEKGSPSSKEEGHWKVPSVVGLFVVLGGFPSAACVPRPDAVVRVVADDDGVVPGCLGEGARQSPRVVLDVVDDGAFGDPAERWDVADGERGTAVAVDELARVHARTSPMEGMVRRP